MSGLLHNISRWLRKRAQAREIEALKARNVGDGSYVDPSVHVLGWANVRVGHHSVLGADCWLNVNNRGSSEPAIVIGNNCFLGRRNFVNSGAVVRFGDYFLSGPDCQFLGSDHVHNDPMVPYITTGTTLDGVIELGPNCWLGASVIIVGSVRVGFGSIIGTGAVVTRDVPPLSMAVGNPARVVKRFDPRSRQWIAASDWSPEAEAALPSETAYLEALRKTHPAVKLPRIASSKTFGDL